MRFSVCYNIVYRHNILLNSENGLTMTIAVIIWYLYKENDRVLFSGHYETKRNDLISMGSEKYNQQNGTKKKNENKRNCGRI